MTLGVGMNLDLRLDRLAQLLLIADERPSVQELGERLGFHRTMSGSLRSWARHLGLLEDRVLTTFARALLRADPTLEATPTRTLLYAHLARNPDAEVFFFMVNEFLYERAVQGGAFSIADIREAARTAGVGAGSAARHQLDREVPLMLRSLTRGAFAPLRLVERSDGHFRAHALVIPPAVGAVLLAQAWPSDSTHRSFAELEQPGGLGRVALASRSSLVGMLRQIEQQGGIVVEEEADLNRVTRIQMPPAESLLERCYDG